MGGDEFAILCDGIGARDEAIALGDRDSGDVRHAVRRRGARCSPDQRLRLCALSHLRQPSRTSSFVSPTPRSTAQKRSDAAASPSSTRRRKTTTRSAAPRLRTPCAGQSRNRRSAVVFQPIVDLATGGISGFETLARWNDDALGPIAPSVFIPVAERIGVIDELSRDLLRKAARIAAQWPSDRLAVVQPLRPRNCRRRRPAFVSSRRSRNSACRRPVSRWR